MSSLSNLNLGASILHLIMALFLAGWFSTRKDSQGQLFIEKSTKLYTDDIDFVPTGNVNEYTLANKLTESPLDMFPYQEAVAFFAITAIAHMFYYYSNSTGMYGKAVKAQNNYFRWIEYSLSATLMLRIIATQTGIIDASTLGLITGNCVSVMLCGQIVETALHQYSLGNIDNKTAKNLCLVSTGIGWILLLSAFTIIFAAFGNQVKTIDDKNCDKNVPDFVWAIIMTQFLFFMSFGIIQIFQMYQVLYVNKNYNFEKIEKAYIINSFISKFTLGVILAFSIEGSDRGSNTTFVCQ